MYSMVLSQEMSWLAAGGLSYGAIYARRRHRLATGAGKLYRSLEPAHCLLTEQSQHGYSPHALVSLAQDARVWRYPGTSGGIVFQRLGRVWLAAGDPIAPPQDWRRLATSFVAAAQRFGAVPAFVPATEHFARNALDWGLSAVKVGASPYFDLQSWNPRGDRARHLRSSLNRALREEISVETVPSSAILAKECRRVCASWLDTRPAGIEFGWLFSLDPLRFAEHKRFFTARNHDGELVGLLAASPIPARRGWYLEDVLRRADAPRGTADLLVHHALNALRAEGADTATLGTALLSCDGEDLTLHDQWAGTVRSLRWAHAGLDRVYHFSGLRNFKAKFVPTRWEGEYAVVAPPTATVPLRVTLAVVSAVLQKKNATA